jgi:hypothetical protein
MLILSIDNPVLSRKKQHGHEQEDVRAHVHVHI